MANRSLHDLVRVTRLIQAQTITSSNIQASGLDTRDFDSVMFVVDYGDIAEMGASPEGAAQIEIHLEDSPDDVTYTDVETIDIDGDSITVTAGVVATITSDLVETIFSYIGDKRYVRPRLEPTGLSTGGPVHVHAVLGHAHLTPVTQG